MILKVPLTGELVAYSHKKPEEAKGSPEKPVCPVNFGKLLPVELCDFKWTAIEYDFENGFVTIEVEFAKRMIVTEWDNTGDSPLPLVWHDEGDAEFSKRQADTENALRDTFEKKTADELYAITNEPRLKKPLVTL